MKINMDSKFHQTVVVIADFCWFGILWVLCSLPILTSGAAAAALSRMCFNLREGKATGTGAFFAAFRENFRQATVIWILELAAAAMLVGSRLLMKGFAPGAPYFAANAGWFLFLILFSAIFIYAIPTVSYFSNTTVNILKNSLIFGFYKPLTMILIAALAAIPAAVFFLAVDIFLFFLPLWIMVWPGLMAYLSCLMIRKVFLHFAPQEQTDPEDDQ